MVCAVAWIILGWIQPSGFTHAVGIIGNPYSWQLWTLSMATFMTGIALLACTCLRIGARAPIPQTRATLFEPLGSDRDRPLEKISLLAGQPKPWAHVSPYLEPYGSSETLAETFTLLDLKNYYYGMSAVKTHGSKQIFKESCDFILDERYCARNDVAIFNEKGEVYVQLGSEPIPFAYSCALEINDETLNIEILKNILSGYAQVNLERHIPKLLIPMAADPPGGIPHALLLVVELQPLNSGNAKVSLVDSFGSKSSYTAYAEIILKTVKSVFPSSLSIQNTVCQQSDNWSCGAQMIENLDLLSSINNAYDFIQEGSLPLRSAPEIMNKCDSVYRSYVEKGWEKWKALVTPEKQKEVLDQLEQEGKTQTSSLIPIPCALF